MKKTVALVGLLFVSSFAAAEVLVVNVFAPMPGKGPLTVQHGREARAIHQQAGAQVVLGTDQMGRLHYAMAFENWTAWAAFEKKMQGNEAWTAFLDKINQAPSATLEENFMMNVAAPNELGNVIQVFIWQPEPGRLSETLEAGMTAKGIHDKAGAKVSINVDNLNRAHYVMSFDSWETWAKFQDTPNEEFAKFLAEFNQDPPAQLVRVYTITQVE